MGHGTSNPIKGCQLRGRSIQDTIAAVSAARNAGSDLFSCTSTEVDTESITGRKNPSRNWDPKPIARDLPLPITAFANRTVYKVIHVQVRFKFSNYRNAFACIIPFKSTNF